MLQRRVPGLVAVAGLAVMLVSCEGLFDFNAFQALDKPAVPAASDYQGAEGLARLSADLDSPAVVAVLEANPLVLAEIEADLYDTYLGDGISGTTDQQAAILYADLILKTTSGEALVNNAAALFADGIDGTKSLADLVGPLVPPDARTSEGFAAMIQGLLDANDAYLALGASIDADGDGVAEGALPEGTRVGDVAQKAAAAAIVAMAVDAIAAATPEDPIQQLFYLVYSPEQTSAEVQSLLTSDAIPSFPPETAALMDLAGITIAT